jgi:hypothetical protein
MRSASWLVILTIVSAPPLRASTASAFEPGAICRTAIASVADRDPKAVQISRTVGDILFLTYTRPIDNFVWTYRCRIDGNRIVWASEPGRWRDGPKDDKILFEDVGGGKQLRIIANHRDGTSTKQVFDRDKVP